MIPLGSCTMKLNGTSEMLPVTWPEFARMHPFAPGESARAVYAELCSDLETWLAEITGFAAVSLQPNAGSQGEYAGLLAIRGYHESRDVGPIIAARQSASSPSARTAPIPPARSLPASRSSPSLAMTTATSIIGDLRAKAEKQLRRSG